MIHTTLTGSHRHQPRPNATNTRPEEVTHDLPIAPGTPRYRLEDRPPPLPVALSNTVGQLTQHGKDLALYYGDFLVGVLFRVAADVPGEAGRVLVRLITDTLYVNQRGQLAELLAEEKPLTDVTIGDLLLIGERKAAHYCYSFPFVLGATLVGHAIADIEPAVRLLLKIGTASQVVDDIPGTFPGVIDHDKDTLGEIANLRCRGGGGRW
ncbi:MAG: polyprenyl synthetase family protein [Pseudonocardiales bacterium]|nr:polyprenyl synthetase family protein [Pseudonocardiales bacterium]